MKIKPGELSVCVYDGFWIVAEFYEPDAMRHAVQFVAANRAWDALVTLSLKHEWTLTKDGGVIELHAYSGDVQVSQASTTVDDLLSAIARVVMADSPEVTA